MLSCFPGPDAAVPLWNIFPTLIDLYPWFLKYCNQLDNHTVSKNFQMDKEGFKAKFFLDRRCIFYLRESGEIAADESKPRFKICHMGRVWPEEKVSSF